MRKRPNVNAARPNAQPSIYEEPTDLVCVLRSEIRRPIPVPDPVVLMLPPPPVLVSYPPGPQRVRLGLIEFLSAADAQICFERANSEKRNALYLGLQ